MAILPVWPASDDSQPLPEDPPLLVGEEPVSAFDVVVLAGSLGGPEAIRSIVGRLPTWFPAAVIVVQHRTPAAQDLTVKLLRGSTQLPVLLAAEGDRPCPGTVHVLPSDRQLVLGPGLSFARAGDARPRPLADPLLVSVARHVAARALGVILSGTGEDGAAGVVALKRSGGCVLVQSRASARCFAMPAAAIASGCVDLVLPAHRMADALISLTAWPGAASLLKAPLAPWATLA